VGFLGEKEPVFIKIPVNITNGEGAEESAVLENEQNFWGGRGGGAVVGKREINEIALTFRKKEVGMAGQVKKW